MESNKDRGYNQGGRHQTSSSSSGQQPALIEDRITLAVKPHAFAGAVLSPKHARELTPTLCLAIASALAEQSIRKAAVPYTLWITEAWRVLGWAEPSAALFWEMATMYHTLYLAGRAFAADYQDGMMYSNNIPPILSCGSTSSLGSGATQDNTHGGGGGRGGGASSVDRKKFSSAASAKELPVWLVGTFLLLHCEEFAYQRNLSGQDERRFFGAVPAAGQSGGTIMDNGGKMDFTTLFKNSTLSPRSRLHAGWNNDNTHCTAYLLRHLRKVLLLTAIQHNGEAMRACCHLAAIPSPAPVLPSEHHGQNQRNKTGGAGGSGRGGSGGSGGGNGHNRSNSNGSGGGIKYSAEELRRQHDEEHGNVGLSVHLNMEDLERLHLILQPPSGGGIDDPPLRIGDYLFKSLYQTAPPPTANILIGDVEREIRRHLELELLMSGFDQDEKEDVSTDDEDSACKALAKLNLSGASAASTASSGGTLSPSSSPDRKAALEDASERAKQPHNQYHKELSYTHLRGTTILLKPNPSEASSGASIASGDPNFSNITSAGRLHDLAISDCSDAHFYLLQPFEHATISTCTGCTIVVGAVAGLLHVVDCEKTNITSAARRILVSNSSDVQMCVFSPTSPLMVGDNRSVQFAPYNTYYDGLREDLLATGLAAAVVSESQSPFHGSATRATIEPDSAAWPQLQCASNKWKVPVELSKLEVPQVPAAGSSSPPSPAAGVVAGAAGVTGSPSSPGADDKACGKGGGNDATMHAPILLPASEFHILFVPVESSSDTAARQKQNTEDVGATPASGETKEGDANASTSVNGSGAAGAGPMESPYCQWLAEILQLSPFRLPVEYEKRALVKVERMRSIQAAVKKLLNPEQQKRFEEELNRGFRDWLVTSGNLRQVLDLVHLERRGGL